MFETSTSLTNEKTPPEMYSIQLGAKLPSGKEPEEIDVSKFYLASADLLPCTSPLAEAITLAPRLESSNWTVSCSALTAVRCMALHHPDVLDDVLEMVVPHLQRHVRSLRSSVCKTALICIADLFKIYGDVMFTLSESDSPSLLLSLLNKAALGKRFVIDEAMRTLSCMIQHVSCDLLLRPLLVCNSAANHKVRAVVAKVTADLVHIALRDKLPGSQVNDREPRARESARLLISGLKEARLQSMKTEAWGEFVEEVIGKTAAIKILKF